MSIEIEKIDKSTFGIYPVYLVKVFLECYGSYAPDQAHYCQETKGIRQAFQTSRIRLPSSPFYGYNSHQSRGTLEACTILLIYTQ